MTKQLPTTQDSSDRPSDVVSNTQRPHALQAASILLGGIALCGVGLAATLASYRVGDSTRPLLIGFIAWTIAAVRGVFHLHITRDDLFKLGPIVSSSLTGAGTVVVAQALLGNESARTADIAMITGLILLGLVTGLQIGRAILLTCWQRGDYRTTAIVAGGGDIARQLRLELAHRPRLGIDVVDHVALGGDEDDSELLLTAVRAHRPDRLILGEPVGDEQMLLGALRETGMLGTRVYALPRLFEMGLGNPLFTPDRLRGYPLLRANRSLHPQLSFALKRVFDVVVSATTLILVAPLLLIAAIAVRLTSEGPVLFWQDRVGMYGRTFSVPKLRSMSGGETGDTDWTAEARITPIGRVLRRTAVDELPQLWSVLRGDMSLVGPRPERPAFAEQFSSQHPGYSDRLRMRSGLTGLSQIAGLRGDTPIAERTKYDNLYIDQWSLMGDLVILLRTVVAIVKEGTYAQEHLDLEEIIRLDGDRTPHDHIDVRTQSGVDLRANNSHLQA